MESAGNRGVWGEGGMLKRLFYGGPPIGVLHEQYAKKGRVDDEAPMKASYEVLIEAPWSGSGGS
jgi:hypothetical protein